MKYSVFFLIFFSILSCFEEHEEIKCISFKTSSSLVISYCIDSALVSVPDSILPKWGKIHTECHTLQKDTMVFKWYANDGQLNEQSQAISYLKNKSPKRTDKSISIHSLESTELLGGYTIESNRDKTFIEFIGSSKTKNILLIVSVVSHSANISETDLLKTIESVSIKYTTIGFFQ